MNKKKGFVLCPICEKKHNLEYHEAEFQRYPHLKNSYVHSKVSCSFCSQNMVILYNKETSSLRAINESWLLELKAHNSFSKLIKIIINDMENEIFRNNSFQMRLELMKLKDVRESMYKRHNRVQKKYTKQKMEWRTNLLIDELRCIDRQSESKS